MSIQFDSASYTQLPVVYKQPFDNVSQRRQISRDRIQGRNIMRKKIMYNIFKKVTYSITSKVYK